MSERSKKPVYKPEKWRKLADKGHVTQGKCPCGVEHGMVDRDPPKKVKS